MEGRRKAHDSASSEKQRNQSGDDERRRQLIEWTAKVAPLRSASEAHPRHIGRKTLRCKVREPRVEERRRRRREDGCRAASIQSAAAREARKETHTDGVRRRGRRQQERVGEREKERRRIRQNPCERSIDLLELASSFRSGRTSERSTARHPELLQHFSTAAAAAAVFD